MKPVPFAALALATAFYGVTAAESAFKITSLDGSAKVQHSLKRGWEKLSIGDAIADNDMVETFFQSRLVLAFDSVNIVILGSNSKALFGLAPAKTQSAANASVNLFAGGVLVKMVTHRTASVFTANAVAEVDSGVVSAVVDPKSGHTGFQVLGGSARVRNVAQHESSPLGAGQTTIILPAQEPSTPLYITRRHVSVLKHYFGEEYIDKEMKASNIIPTDDNTATDRLSFSRALAGSGEGPADQATYKPVFDFDKIYGNIQGDEERTGRLYYVISNPGRLSADRYQLGVQGSSAYVNNTAYPAFEALPAFVMPHLAVELRLPYARDAYGDYSFHLSSAQGILDKIGTITVSSQAESTFVSLGPITNYTIMDGVVVKNFSNQDPYSVLSTAGLVGQIKLYPVNVKGFIADVSSFRMGGVHFCLEPSVYQFGIGYYYDLNQYERPREEESPRFVQMPPDTANPSPDSVPANFQCYELDAAFDLINVYQLQMHFMMQFAQKFSLAGLEGFALNGPGMDIEWRRVKFGGGFHFERGRTIAGEFNEFYMTNRSRIIDGDTVVTLNGLLSSKRQVKGIHVDFGVSPLRGTSCNLYYRTDFGTWFPFTGVHESDSTFVKNNFEYRASVAIDKDLFPFIKFFEAYVGQVDGGYFPENGTYFSSWGFETGADLATAPILFNVALEAGFKFYYLDLDPSAASPKLRFNGTVDHGDRVTNMYAGLRWGFH